MPTISVGHARIAQEAATPIQIGENWWGPHDMLKVSPRMRQTT